MTRLPRWIQSPFPHRDRLSYSAFRAMLKDLGATHFKDHRLPMGWFSWWWFSCKDVTPSFWAAKPNAQLTSSLPHPHCILRISLKGKTFAKPCTFTYTLISSEYCGSCYMVWRNAISRIIKNSNRTEIYTLNKSFQQMGLKAFIIPLWSGTFQTLYFQPASLGAIW